MPSLWSIVFLIYALDTLNALEFAPTPTWATLQSSALGWDNLPTITTGTFYTDLKARATNQQNPICGWIGGNAGTGTRLIKNPVSRYSQTRPYRSLALNFRVGK
jgi:hypothetical protein